MEHKKINNKNHTPFGKVNVKTFERVKPSKGRNANEAVAKTDEVVLKEGVKDALGLDDENDRDPREKHANSHDQGRLPTGSF